MDTRSPLLLGSHSVNGIHLTVINCTRWRAPEGKPTCSVMRNPAVLDCAECQYRKPIVGRHPVRGLGDLIAAAVYVLCLGRPRIPQRIAATVEGAAATPGKPGVSGGCGCKRRQDALNRAIPFGKD